MLLNDRSNYSLFKYGGKTAFLKRQVGKFGNEVRKDTRTRFDRWGRNKVQAAGFVSNARDDAVNFISTSGMNSSNNVPEWAGVQKLKVLLSNSWSLWIIDSYTLSVLSTKYAQSVWHKFVHSASDSTRSVSLQCSIFLAICQRRLGFSAASASWDLKKIMSWCSDQGISSAAGLAIVCTISVWTAGKPFALQFAT